MTSILNGVSIKKKPFDYVNDLLYPDMGHRGLPELRQQSQFKQISTFELLMLK